MNKTTTLIVSAVILAANSVLAGAPAVPETASSLGLLLAGIAGLLAARRVFKAA